MTRFHSRSCQDQLAIGQFEHDRVGRLLGDRSQGGCLEDQWEAEQQQNGKTHR